MKQPAHQPPSRQAINQPHPPRQPAAGFTLLELLVVVTVLTLLAAILLGSAPSLFNTAQKQRCISNMRQLGLVIREYALENNDELVPTLRRSRGTTSGVTWVQILHDAGHFERGPRRGDATFPRWHLDPRGVFTCPSVADRESGRRDHQRKRNLSERRSRYGAYYYDGVHYGMFATMGGIDNRRGWDPPAAGRSIEDLNPRAPLRMSQFERPSKIPMLGETNYWYLLAVTNMNFRAYPHSDSMNVLYMDGSLRPWERP